MGRQRFFEPGEVDRVREGRRGTEYPEVTQSLDFRTVLVQLQHVGENGVNPLDRAWLIPIQVKVIHAFERVLRPAGHEVGKCPQRSAE